MEKAHKSMECADKETIGKRIDEIRVAKSMSMRSLAQRSDLAESYLWRIIRGRISNLTVETLKKIACQGLEVPVSALFGEDSGVFIKITGVKRPAWCRADNIAYKIADAVSKFPKEAQELVLVQMESFEKFFTKPKRKSTPCSSGGEL